MQIAKPRGALSTDAIQTMLNAAIARTRELKCELHISIMDSAATLVGFISFDGAPRIAAITANRKAFTAVQTGMPTHEWEGFVNAMPPSEQKIIDSIDGYIAARGGFPVIQDGILLGAIGVSGATQEIDGEVAEAAIRALGL